MTPRDFTATRQSDRLDWPVLCLALAIVAVHLIFHQGYGYFRDELYFLACAEHLDWGYVDHPPLIPAVAWVARLMGGSLLAVRAFPAFLHGGLVLLTGSMTRLLGGDRGARFLAALAVATAPIYLGTFSFLNTDGPQPLGWMGCAYVVMMILKGADPRYWLLVGLIAGLTLYAKHAIVFFAAAFGLGLLLTPARRHLLGRWFWLGTLVAGVLVLPNLLWEHARHWPTWELLQNVKRTGKNVGFGPIEFVLAQVPQLGPFSAPIWMTGLGWLLFSRNGKAFRAFGWAFVFLVGLFVVMKGKDYYLAPVFPILFAAGTVAIERSFAKVWRWLSPAIGVLLVAGAVMAVPFAIPLLPVETFLRYQRALGMAPHRTEAVELGELPQQYADMFGWPEMAACVADVYTRLQPAERTVCGILAADYGEAGAIDFFGRAKGLPPVLCSHQSYFLWGPGKRSGQVMIAVGMSQAFVEKHFEQVELAAVFQHPYAIPDENNLPIYVCRGLKAPSLAAVWPSLKRWR